jgi:protein-S-isoprenylcysteine O-methyltransferase Ste14
LASFLNYAALIIGIPLALVGAIVCIRWQLFWRRNYDGRVITHGPFSWVRHPFYSGFLAFTIGLALSIPASDTIALMIISIFSIFYYMPKEEAEQLQRHKREYEEYKAQVPWKLIPRVY